MALSSMAQMATTTIINGSTHALKIREGSTIRYFAEVPSMKTSIMCLDLNATHRLMAKGNRHIGSAVMIWLMLQRSQCTKRSPKICDIPSPKSVHQHEATLRAQQHLMS